MWKIVNFTSDFTWYVSLASDLIMKTHWKYSEFCKWFLVGRVTGTWQAIREMSIRNKWSPVGLRKIFIWIFTCEKADIPYNYLYGVPLVLRLCKRACPTGFTRGFTNETFFLELKGIDWPKKKFATPTLAHLTLKSVYRPHNHILRSRVGGAFQSLFAACISPFPFGPFSWVTGI